MTTIKQLDWHGTNAVCIIGTYWFDNNRMMRNGPKLIASGDGFEYHFSVWTVYEGSALEQAKAAAQADFENIIRSAIVDDQATPAAQDEAAGKAAYQRMTDNDPIVHSNRFPSWSELTDEQRQEWITRTKTSPRSCHFGCPTIADCRRRPTCDPETLRS